MKIKVLTIKDISKYLAKISIIFGIIAIFANFFSHKKNINSFLNYDTRKYISVIKREIVLLKNGEESNLNLYNTEYISKTLKSELGVFKVANSKEITRDVTGNDNSNQENQNNIVEESNNLNVNENEIEEVATNVNTEVLPSNIVDKTSYEIFGVKLRNESDYNLENEITDLNVEFNKNDIIIFHTHTCESYTQTEQNQYDSTGNYRTTNLNYSVARVGDELEKYLQNYGFNVIHDKSYHDYPSYNGSYNRSLVTVKKL